MISVVCVCHSVCPRNVTITHDVRVCIQWWGGYIRPLVYTPSLVHPSSLVHPPLVHLPPTPGKLIPPSIPGIPTPGTPTPRH